MGDKERFSGLLDASLIPQLRKALVAWAPRDFEPCIRLMETCQRLLRTEVAESLVAEVGFKDGSLFLALFFWTFKKEGARSLIKLGSDTSVIPQNDQFDVQGIKGTWFSHVFFH